MKTVTVGLPEREAFAVSLLMRKLRPDWAFESRPADADDLAGDRIVLDTDAWQARHGADSGDAQLRALLHDKPAVLLTAPLGLRPETRAQADATARDWHASGWIVLRRPFRAAAMRDALSRAEQHALAARMPPPDPPRRALPAPSDLATQRFAQAHAERRFSPAAEPLLGGPAAGGSEQGRTTQFSSSFLTTTVLGSADGEPATSAAGLPPPEITADELSVAAFAACVQTSPLAECRHFLGHLADRLARPGAFEMGFTLINGIVFDAAANWVASNTPMSVVRMVARSRTLGAHIQWLDLGPSIDPRARAAQRGRQVYRLGALLHALARMAECRLPAR